MINTKASRHPIIDYRPIRPTDLEALEKIHCELFPIRYESEFFHSVANGCGIVSWAAVDRAQPKSQNDELIGFVTARIVIAKESEIEDLISFESPKLDETLVYILTLGVAESYRNIGVASSLIREVIKYASSITSCRAVYLHVISYNNPAILLYKRMSFQCVRKLDSFYFINGQHYDAYLFIYYVNGGRSRCSPMMELVALLLTHAKTGFKSVAAIIWRMEDKKVSKWPRNRETGCLLPSIQNKMTTN